MTSTVKVTIPTNIPMTRLAVASQVRGDDDVEVGPTDAGGAHRTRAPRRTSAVLGSAPVDRT